MDAHDVLQKGFPIPPQEPLLETAIMPHMEAGDMLLFDARTMYAKWSPYFTACLSALPLSPPLLVMSRPNLRETACHCSQCSAPGLSAGDAAAAAAELLHIEVYVSPHRPSIIH